MMFQARYCASCLLVVVSLLSLSAALSPRSSGECQTDSECTKDKYCEGGHCVNRPRPRNKCQDTCGPNSDCKITKVRTSCKCLPGYTGYGFDRNLGCTIGHNSTNFQLIDAVATWEDAFNHCHDKGGDLAELNTSQKHLEATTLLNEYYKGQDGVGVWIGGRCSSNSYCEWLRTETCFNRGFTKWQTSKKQPDTKLGQFCVAQGTGEGVWALEPCGMRFPFLCQYNL